MNIIHADNLGFKFGQFVSSFLKTQGIYYNIYRYSLLLIFKIHSELGSSLLLAQCS